MKNKNKFPLFIGIVLAVVLVLLFNLGINNFYPNPEYQDYCTPNNAKSIETKEECEQMNGKWVEIQCITEPCGDYCDLYYYCGNSYDKARNSYNSNLFYIFLVGGLMIFAFSLIFLKDYTYFVMGLAGGASLIIEAFFRNLDNTSQLFYGGVIAFGFLLFLINKYKGRLKL